MTCLTKFICRKFTIHSTFKKKNPSKLLIFSSNLISLIIFILFVINSMIKWFNKSNCPLIL